ncbi:hypothetical protein STRAU_6474 [Streptomyces aurantiacus JA 4570]|uniref:Uncharacterized protein n=1 Tax=Streptomyces aurantiacus JA 4570 TaxID=1286094 RepID=S4AG31_9ACTN|nr:hypothetical protein STRAU_6474 [Streptomyces aurantiacus JA 4570]
MASRGIGQSPLAVERVGDSRDGDTGCGGDVSDACSALPVAPAGGLRSAHLVLPCCCHGEPIVGLMGVGSADAYAPVDRHVSAWWKAVNDLGNKESWAPSKASLPCRRAGACQLTEVSKRSQLTSTGDARHGASHRRVPGRGALPPGPGAAAPPGDGCPCTSSGGGAYGGRGPRGPRLPLALRRRPPGPKPSPHSQRRRILIR